jgi:UDP-N-acetylmuramate dehydrogenase
MTALTKMFAFGARIHRPSLDGIWVFHMNEKENIKVQTKVPLKGLSTFKVGGDASHFFEINDKSELRVATEFARSNDFKIFVLGGGSNVLFSDDGFNGLLVKLNSKGITFNKLSDKEVLVTAEAGEDWDGFVEWTLEHNSYGLENLSAIPGTVGASPVQNIGAYGVEVKDLIDSVEVFDIKTLEYKVLSNKDCCFGYRNSIFKNKEFKNLIVTSVTFKLSLVPKINISYKDLQNYFKENTSPTPKEVRESVMIIRKGKFPDLNIYGTAGSFFKNIICYESDIEELKKQYADMPVYKVEGYKVKVSTAYVLDKVCGLKGYRIGDVGLFENQSLVVVNYGNVTGFEVRKFVEKVKGIVKEKTGIQIEEEVVLA